jgi:hypothetical protein
VVGELKNELKYASSDGVYVKPFIGMETRMVVSGSPTSKMLEHPSQCDISIMSPHMPSDC